MPLSENRTPPELAACYLENMRKGDQDCWSAVCQHEVGQKSALPNRSTSGIVGGSDITFRRQRRVVINPSVRFASFILKIVPLNDFLSVPPHSQT